MAKRARRTNKSCKRFSQRKPEPKAIGATISPAVKSRRAARKKKISRSSSLFIRRLSQASQMSMTMKTRPATIEGLKRQHQSVQKDCLKGKAEFQPGKPAVSQLLKARGKSTGNVVMTPKAILLCLAKIMPLGAMFTAIQILGSRDKSIGPKSTNPTAIRMKIQTTILMTAVLTRIMIQVQTTVKTAKEITIARITNLQAKSPKNESWSFFTPKLGNVFQDISPVKQQVEQDDPGSDQEDGAVAHVG